jgi:hypothetical protein
MICDGGRDGLSRRMISQVSDPLDAVPTTTSCHVISRQIVVCIPSDHSFPCVGFFSDLCFWNGKAPASNNNRYNAGYLRFTSIGDNCVTRRSFMKRSKEQLSRYCASCGTFEVSRKKRF